MFCLLVTSYVVGETVVSSIPELLQVSRQPSVPNLLRRNFPTSPKTTVFHHAFFFSRFFQSQTIANRRSGFCHGHQVVFLGRAQSAVQHSDFGFDFPEPKMEGVRAV